MQKLKPKDIEKVPLSRSGRMKGLTELPNKAKANFLPNIGAKLRIGPYVFKVTAKNIGRLRFSAELHDVIIEGVNDEMPVIEPT